MIPDILYTIREGEDNEELRYSLRSLQNISHGNVFIAGYCPSWVTNVIHIPTTQHELGGKYHNAKNNLATACADERLGEFFILMNDDFFIMEKVDKLPIYHRGSLKRLRQIYYDKFGGGDYLFGIDVTIDLLEDIGTVGDVNSYEMHIPLLMEKSKRNELTKLFEHSNHKYHTRTLYAQMYGLQGEESHDFKVYDEGEQNYKD